MSSTQQPKCSRGGSSHQRRRHISKGTSSPSKTTGGKKVVDLSCLRLQELLGILPLPCPSMQVIRPIGEGTFSKVFLVKEGDKKIAVKHLVPTASPDRILMEVECLRMAEGEENVIPLQFVYRHLGDVLLAMPYIECCKFSDVVRTMDHVEVRMYMRHLLRALAHIHNLGIIHRDIKPANFLYDRSRGVFKLVDFGLAQRVGEAGQVSERRTAAAAVTAAFISAPPQPQCKRKLTSSDLANSMESPPPSAHHSKRQKLHHPSGERGASRKVLTDKTFEDVNVKLVNSSTKKETPTKNNSERPDQVYYDRRGSMLSAHKRTRSATRTNRSRLSDDIDHPGDPADGGGEEDLEKTPNKNLSNIKEMQEVRRSPRKHASSLMKTPGFSKLTISASAIVNASDKTPNGLKRQGSFTMLDPASGVPSDGTPRLQASLTSRHSTAALIMPNGAMPFSSATAVNIGQQCLMVNNSACLNASNPKEQAQVTFSASGRFVTPNPRKTACTCFAMSQVCNKCLSRRSQRAARAGTPGFRPPEVLMKFEHQTTAVDMWAAGVILLSILSRTYPFFRAPDDLTALAELLSMFGKKAVQEAAGQYGKRLICSELVEPVDLQVLCQRLAERRQPEEMSKETSSSLNLASDQAVDLLSKILTLSSHERLTAEDALRHPFFED